MTEKQLPVFATNRPDDDLTVAEAVNRLFRIVRTKLSEPPSLAIATAYLNAGGYSLLADELELAPRVRLLLGAEPDPSIANPANPPVRKDQVTQALSRHAEWLAAERDLTGFTRKEDAAAKRLVDWLRSTDDEGIPVVEVRRYTHGFLHGKAYLTEDDTLPAVLAGSSNMTYAGLARNAELNLGYGSASESTRYVQDWFEWFWDRSEPYDLAGLYADRWAPHSPWTIFLRMLWEYYSDHLEDDDVNVRTQLNLTGYQREGVARMLRLLEQNGGVIVADEVGLGKTYMAGEVIARAANRDRQRVLIVAPAALKTAMWEPFLEQYDFSRWVHVLSYAELRRRWDDANDETRRRLDDYALVVVDEAHNLRNPNAQRTEAVNALIGGVSPKKLVLLTATPVNNSLQDLRALISLFIRNDAAFAANGIPSIQKYIKRAQDMDPDALSPEHLFDLMDEVAVRRTRQFVKKHYKGDSITLPDGTEQTIRFPDPELKRLDYELDEIGEQLLEEVVYALDSPDDHPGFTSRYEQRAQDDNRLMLARYTPGAYSRDGSPAEAYQISNAGLLKSSLLKRLESSPIALANTLGTLIGSHDAFLDALDNGWVLAGDALREWTSSDAPDFDEFLAELDEIKSTQVDDAASYHGAELRQDVSNDRDLLHQLRGVAQVAASEEIDQKAERLVAHLRSIAADARRVDKGGLSESDRRKTIVFSTFADTISDLHRRVVKALDAAAGDDPLSDYQGRVAPPVSGSSSGTDQDQRFKILAGFAPDTAGGEHSVNIYDLLFTTDVLSEGVNLQQAGRIVNYDLPWNPMRIVQRHGRIDRIGSPHGTIYLNTFFPARNLDTLLRLEERLHRKLAQADAAVGTGLVIPGFEPGAGQLLADTGDKIAQIYNEDATLLDTNHAALSGEEYRKRLTKATGTSLNTKTIASLPYGSGSGFINPRIATPGYVFCIRIDGQPQPKFRFVPTSSEWVPLTDDEGNHIVESDTLTALIAGDPQTEESERHLTDDAYANVFDAWEVSQMHVHAEWQGLADGTALKPDVPKAMRDAAELLFEHGQHLDIDTQQDLLSRLNTAPGARVTRQIRAIVNDADLNPKDKLADIQQVINDAGIQPPEPPPELQPITLDQIRLVTWMAVSTAEAP